VAELAHGTEVACVCGCGNQRQQGVSRRLLPAACGTVPPPCPPFGVRPAAVSIWGYVRLRPGSDAGACPERGLKPRSLCGPRGPRGPSWQPRRQPNGSAVGRGVAGGHFRAVGSATGLLDAGLGSVLPGAEDRPGPDWGSSAGAVLEGACLTGSSPTIPMRPGRRWGPRVQGFQAELSRPSAAMHSRAKKNGARRPRFS
jgi:hypothetical protein